MGFIKNTIFLAGAAGLGFAGYQMANKTKEYKADYEKPITFGGKDEKVTGDFTGATYGLLCSGLNLDLTKATMSVDEAVLTIKAEFSGVAIKVPADWNVKVDGISDKGGVSVDVAFDEEDTTSKRLIIDYDVKYGGLDIRYGKVKEDVEEEEDTIDIDLEDIVSEVN